MKVAVFDTNLAVESFDGIEKVFFINEETHSDELRLSGREDEEKVLYVNTSLALAVEVSP